MKWFVGFLIFPFLLLSFEPRPITPEPILGYQEVSFFDESQQQHRSLLIWYPVEAQTKGVLSSSPWDTFKVAVNAPLSAKTKLPIVVISHGYTGNPHQLSWLIRGLVHSGFIVIGIQHADLIQGKAHANHWRRPLDVRKILNVFSKNSLSESADLNKIGIAGFSLGGTTAIWVAGGRSTKLDTLIPGPDYAAPEDYVRADEALPSLNKEMMAEDWRDPRVKAAFVMAPAWAWLFDEESLKQVSIPTYLIAAAADQVLVTSHNAGFFARFIPKAFYQEVPGKANHYIFISALNAEQRKNADPTGQLTFLFEEDASVNRAWIQMQTAGEAVRFFRWAFSL
jgi:predicted dienelactone hydrolase